MKSSSRNKFKKIVVKNKNFSVLLPLTKERERYYISIKLSVLLLPDYIFYQSWISTFSPLNLVNTTSKSSGNVLARCLNSSIATFSPSKTDSKASLLQ